jgi:hypothetical protein
MFSKEIYFIRGKRDQIYLWIKQKILNIDLCSTSVSPYNTGFTKINFEYLRVFRSSKIKNSFPWLKYDLSEALIIISVTFSSENVLTVQFLP